MEDTFHDYSFAEALAEKVNVALEEVVRVLEHYIKPLMNALYDWLRKFYDLLYQFYLDSGVPFGKTPEGMQLWLEERIADNQRKQEAGARAMGYGQDEDVPLDYLLYLDDRLKRRLN